MDIKIGQIDDGYHLVRCSGELRADDGALMVEQLQPLIAEHENVAPVVIELSEVTWMDSGGLSHLISLVTRARLAKSRVVLLSPSPFVSGVLEVTGLDCWFEIAKDLAEARKRLGSSS